MLNIMDVLPEYEGDWTKDWKPNAHGQFFWGLGSVCICQEGFKGLEWDTQLLNVIIKTQLMKWGYQPTPRRHTSPLPAEPMRRTQPVPLIQTPRSMMVLADCGDTCLFGDLSIHSYSWRHIDLRQEVMSVPSHFGAKSWKNRCFPPLSLLVDAEDW